MNDESLLEWWMEFDDAFDSESSLSVREIIATAKQVTKVTSRLLLTWKTVLAIAAALDFMATVLPRHFLREGGDGAADDFFMELEADNLAVGSVPLDDNSEDSFSSSSIGQAILRWMNRNGGKIGFIFSILWFFESFLEASQQRDLTLRKNDKKRLLTLTLGLQEGLQEQEEQQQEEDQEKEPKGASSSGATGKTEAEKMKTKEKEQEEEEAEDDQSSIDELFGYYEDDYDSWIAFYWQLIKQLMLLPVGFYSLFSEVMTILLSTRNSLHQVVCTGDEIGHNSFHVLEKTLRETYELSKDNKNLALGIAFLNKFLDTLLRFAERQGIKIKQILLQEILNILKHIIGSAIFHPIQFVGKVKNTLAFIRWFRYLQPIIGTSNKLKGNLQDLMKKYQQRQRAKWIHQMLVQKTRKEQVIWATLKIQSCYRSFVARKKLRALKILQGSREVFVAIKLQSIFRRKLAQARARLKRKKLELRKLQAKAAVSRQNRSHLKRSRGRINLLKESTTTTTTTMTRQERMRLYQLEEEFHVESAKLINQKMILKPNTKFAVTWKIMFCCCVVFEITGLIINPMLKPLKHLYYPHDEVVVVDANGGITTTVTKNVPMTVDRIVRNILIPKPFKELDECKCESVVFQPTNRKERWKAILLGRRNYVPQCDGPFPWYCTNPTMNTIRSTYITIGEFCIDQFLVLVGLVCYLDVYVSFFTGEYDDRSGVLIPKPWFVRWILPGLVLQLLVNPQMSSTSRLLAKIVWRICEIGPVRVWRWNLAFFYPVFVAIYKIVLERVWIRFVLKENHETSSSDPSYHPRRRMMKLDSTQELALALSRSKSQDDEQQQEQLD